MKILPFEIQKTIDNTPIVIYPTLIQVNGNNYLVDCGYEETYAEFVSELNKVGVTIRDLSAILISHDDIDHIGALKLFKDDNPDLIIYSSQIEAASISGKVKSERLRQAEATLSTIAEEYRPWALKFIAQLQSIKRIDVDLTLHENDRIEDEIQVVSTPGHTQGHISFYIPAHSTLIANDALVVEGGEFNLANPQFTLDREQAVQSVEKIRALGAEKIICYHGGIAEGNISAKLSALIDKYKLIPATP